MTLRTKTLLIVGLTLGGLGVALYLLVNTIWLAGLATVEDREMREDVRQTTAAIDSELKGLSTLSHDYAMWDDTWRYVEERHAEYEKSNLVDATFIDAGLNLLVIADRSGRSIFARAFDHVGGRQAELPAGAHRMRNDHPGLFHHESTSSSAVGIILLDGHPMLVAAHPILHSDRSGPIRGTLIMGRHLDDAKRRELEEATGFAISIRPIDGTPLPAEFAAAFAAFEGGAPTYTAPLDGKTMAGYALERDVADTPVVLVRVERPRYVIEHGRRTLASFVIALVVIGVLFGGVTLVLLERFILRRVTQMAGMVRKIGAAGDLSARLPVHGRDELSRLSASINATLGALARSQGALQYIGKHARCILWSATVTRDDQGRFEQDLRMHDEESAQRLLPLDLFHGGSYAHAWRRSIHPGDQPRVLQAAADAAQGGMSAYGQTFRVRDKLGALHWIQEEVDVEAISSNRWRLVGVCTDVSSTKDAEAQLQRARDAALEMSEMKSGFLANMSHEIRTPMNGILGVMELLRSTDLSGEQREYVEMIASSAGGLMEVINEILDFSKLEAGKLELEQEEFDVRDSIGEVLHLLAVRAHERGLELALDVESDVPESLVGDVLRIRQVLTNLVANAIKFTEHGEVVVHARVDRVDARQLWLQLAVADTGIGIAEEKQRLIFQAFRQADSSTTRRYGGTGLGLAICAQLAASMHGRIEVESAPGQGSTFRFTALLRTGSRGAAPPPPLPLSAVARVLVVDDNEANRQIARRLVEQVGLEAVTAEGADAARAALYDAAAAGRAFSIILCDATMPRSDGFTFVRSLDEAGAFDGKVVMMLGSADRAAEVRRSREIRATATVVKPLRLSELRRALAVCLGVLVGPGVPDARAAGSATAAGAPGPAAAAGQATEARHAPNVEDGEPDLAEAGSIFDREAALESVEGDEELLAELLRIFFDDWPAQRGAIEAASADGDYATVGRVAHALCGALANLHASVALRTARHLERAAESLDGARVASAAKALVGAVAQFQAYRSGS